MGGDQVRDDGCARAGYFALGSDVCAPVPGERRGRRVRRPITGAERYVPDCGAAPALAGEADEGRRGFCHAATMCGMG
jgi:hypothetical protein